MTGYIVSIVILVLLLLLVIWWALKRDAEYVHDIVELSNQTYGTYREQLKGLLQESHNRQHQLDLLGLRISMWIPSLPCIV